MHLQYAVCVVKKSVLNTIKGLGCLQSAGLVLLLALRFAGVEELRLMMIYSVRCTVRVNRSKSLEEGKYAQSLLS